MRQFSLHVFAKVAVELRWEILFRDGAAAWIRLVRREELDVVSSLLEVHGLETFIDLVLEVLGVVLNGQEQTAGDFNVVGTFE